VIKEVVGREIGVMPRFELNKADVQVLNGPQEIERKLAEARRLGYRLH
jgi:hypothetical protein